MSLGASRSRGAAAVGQLRGLGTLTAVVGVGPSKTTVGHVARCLARIAEEQAELDDDTQVRCPVCGKPFGEVVSESQMARHVEACLCDRNGNDERGARLEPEPDADADADADAQPDDSLDGEDALSGLSFSTVVVGRRYASGGTGALTRGLDVRISLELNNPYDPNALRCTTPSGAAIGFLPAPVAAKLAPLIRARAVSLTAVTTRDAPKLENAPVSVTVRFHSANVDATPNAAANAADAAPIDLDAQDALVDTLRAIAKEHRDNLSQASRRFLDRLKHVFQTVETIERRAIGDDELALFRAFERLTPPAQLLFARLSLRNKTYFASNKIHTSDVHDVQKTVRELLAAELCAPVDVMDLKSSPASLATAVVDDVFSNKAELIDMLAAMNKPAKANAKRDELVAGVSRGVRSQQQLKWSFVVGRVGRVGATATGTGTGTSASASASAPAKLMSDACGTVFKIDSRRLLAFHRTIRLFFLNEGHSLGTLYAVDAGAVRYPTFPITRAREVFPDRSAFLEYEQALLDAHALIGAIDRAGAHRQADRDASDEILTAALAPAWHFLDTQSNKVPPDPTVPPFLRQYSARWLYCVQATVGVGILERQKNYPTAIERIQQLLGGHDCSERRGHWWIRLSTDLEHVGRPTDALELAETALADPAIADHERLTLRKRVLKLSKPPRRWLKPAWKDDMPSDPRIVTIHAAAQPSTGAVRQARVRYAPLYATSTTTTPTSTTPTSTTTTTTPTSTISVEQLALDYYASDTGGNWDGIHTEGRIFTTLFTLLLWPALFELPVPDAFRTSLQTAPLDLDSPGFSECRTAKIHEILAAVRDGHAPRLLEERWTTHHGVNARGIGNWDQWNLDQLKTIVRCLGGAAIASILGILCRDYRAMTAGMPDLVLWNADRCAAKLSEVKSQRDSLSDKQILWIHELEKAGIDVEVLQVREHPSSGRKRRVGDR